MATQAAPRRSCLAYIFVSPTEPRLRAGWRLLLQTALLIALTIAISAVGVLVALVLRGDLQSILSQLDSLPAMGTGQLGELLAVTGSILLVRRFLDKRSFVSLGLALEPRTLIDILAGIGMTFVMMGVIFLAEWALGWLHLSGFAWSSDAGGIVLSNVLLWLAVFIVVGWNEELLTRGYHLQTIASGMGLPWGLFLSSAVFGVLHLGNPHATWYSAAGILFAGLLLGFAYIRTGRLWLSIGLHIGWNFFEGVIFGFPVSGLTTYKLARIVVQGPTLWTGGEFGPEAGLIVLPAIFVAVLLVYLYTRGRPRAAA